MGQYYPFFKAYDVRAKVPDELDAALAKRIGRAFVAELGAKTVVVGRDMRLSSEELADALIDAGYQIRVDSAVENENDVPGDAVALLLERRQNGARDGRDEGVV